MNNLILSMTRLSTAMTLFSVEQAQRTMKVFSDGSALAKTVEGFETTLNSLTEVLAGKMESKNRNALDTVTKVTADTMARTVNGVGTLVSQDAFEGTAHLIERARDAAAGWIGKGAAVLESATEGLQPSPKMLGMISYVLPPLTRAISMFIPGRDSKVAWRNAENNAEIIRLVVNVSSMLPSKDAPDAQAANVPLSELVDKCYALGTFPALWAVEGLGHYYADTFYERNETPHHVLTDPQLASLPSKSMTMLHAGIGLAFAQHGLMKLNSKSSLGEVRQTVEHFVELCRNSSRQGYTGAAIESLGLVSRNFHGLRMLRIVNEALAEIEPELVSYLWRGAGRAVYFSAPNFIPAVRTPWRAVYMCQEEPPHDLGRRNMLAGFAWAVTVVNMRNPIIMETLLKYHGQEFAANDAFSNGVMSSMIMRYDTSPDDPNIEAFCNYRPLSGDARLNDLWATLVRVPCQRAVHEFYPVLREHQRLGEVFHYQDLGALVENLKKTTKVKAPKEA